MVDAHSCACLRTRNCGSSVAVCRFVEIRGITSVLLVRVVYSNAIQCNYIYGNNTVLNYVRYSYSLVVATTVEYSTVRVPVL
jgi:hypothetical protein